MILKTYRLEKKKKKAPFLPYWRVLTSWIQCLWYSSQMLWDFTDDSRLNITAYIPFKTKNIPKPPAVIRPPAIPNFFFLLRVRQVQLLNQTFRLKTNHTMLIFHWVIKVKWLYLKVTLDFSFFCLGETCFMSLSDSLQNNKDLYIRTGKWMYKVIASSSVNYRSMKTGKRGVSER